MSIRRMLRPMRDIAAAAKAVPVFAAGVPREAEPRISYGLGRVPRANEVAHGGMVKIQRMQEPFPEAGYRFNILYLVSSSLPRAAVALATAARLKGARVVLNQNGVAYAGWFGPGWETVNAPMARLHGHADFVFYQSDFCRESARRFLGARHRASEVLYNAVDTTQFRPAEAPAPSRPLTLLLGGNQDFKYRLMTGLHVLALVAKARPDVRMLITGRMCWTHEGIATAQARDFAEQFGVAGRLEWIGPYRQDEADKVFARADLLLHTKYNDPSPGVVTEALAFGLPVVYSATGGLPELVGDEAGVGVPADVVWDREVVPDADRLAEGVLHVADRLAAYRVSARRRAVERFDLAPWLKRHDAVFRALLDGGIA
jgi:glycosyltransferase involved in cell wall biosynthesis